MSVFKGVPDIIFMHLFISEWEYFFVFFKIFKICDLKSWTDILLSLYLESKSCLCSGVNEFLLL